ncbi:GTPase IMAP family member 5-like isoform X2 [Boleophthalmus pectinirostris]|uniref:GTPase IMAP family member 5-like isoform X2 n=1 Tax=Boleophthalmus pectinirostris TaxID=150288 RepID=UPI00243302B5|nr:GTPase IMAP family member 5-like isoform X2 [Boleophthalmus pectinirostris]
MWLCLMQRMNLKAQQTNNRKLQDKKISVINCPDLLQLDLTADEQIELVRDIADVCDPGPHVFLLVLQPEDFTEQHNIRLQSVLRNFSEQSFQHSLVLLTATKETSVMQDYVTPPPLKDMIKKCKYRYQWVKSLETNMISEVREELLTKIVQILKENDEKHIIHDIYEDASPAAHQTKEREGLILTTFKKGINIVKMSRSGTGSDSALRIVLIGKSDDKKTKMLNFIQSENQ